MDLDVCKEKHKAIDTELTRHEKWLDTHEQTLSALKTSDATNTNEIKNLCTSIKNQNERMGSLTNAIWGLTSGIFLILVGFVFWYIQSLAR